MSTVVGIIVGTSASNLTIHRDNAEAVLAAGGVPLLIPAVLSHDLDLFEALKRIDALLLAGGGDIEPSLYGAEVRATLDDVDSVRDDVERRAYRWACTQGVRVLGICRGAQLMAALSGGTLIQDLPAMGYRSHLDVRQAREHAVLRHPIKAEPRSLAERILSGLEEVNSHHHQAIATMGPELVATAWSDDGVIEAIEGPRQLGVQWHPESLFAVDNRYLRPFEWLVHGDGGLTR